MYTTETDITHEIIKNRNLDKRNAPPLTMSCAPSGDEGPLFTSKQYIKKTDKTTQKPAETLPQLEADKINPHLCSRVDSAMENRWTQIFHRSIEWFVLVGRTLVARNISPITVWLKNRFYP
jgi:hypothetical protein